MFSPLGCCWSDRPPLEAHGRHQRRKLHLLKGWRDAVERQLAAVNAAISTMEQQMQRDGTSAE
ncbi:MAG: sigma factor SigF [Synechococcus lacustris]|jgi:ATP/maltotriose-dependent transcriptional regulator MalT